MQKSRVWFLENTIEYYFVKFKFEIDQNIGILTFA